MNKLWLKCSAVSVGFYIILYIFLGHYFGYRNPWLILILLGMTVLDIWLLHWWIEKNQQEGRDDFP